MNLLLAINTEKKTTCDAGRTGRSTAPPISRTAPRQVVGRGTQQPCGCWGDALFAGWAAKSVRSWEPYGSRCESPGVPSEYPGVPWSTLKQRGQPDYSGVPWSTLQSLERAYTGRRGRVGAVGGRAGTWQYRRRGRATAWARYPSAWLPLRLGAATRNVQAECISTYSRHLRRVAAACGCSCVMVTHNPQVECYADRVLFMQVGPSRFRRM